MDLRTVKVAIANPSNYSGSGFDGNKSVGKRFRAVACGSDFRFHKNLNRFKTSLRRPSHWGPRKSQSSAWAVILSIFFDFAATDPQRPPLALSVTILAVFATYAKTLGLALIYWSLLSPEPLPVLHILGKLAMADVFLAALYVVLAKGIGHATIQTARGLYLFTECNLASFAVSLAAEPLKE